MDPTAMTTISDRYMSKVILVTRTLYIIDYKLELQAVSNY